MTIASEITKLNTNLTNSYTACQSKGATIPTDQNFDNLATCINSIQTGGGGGGITREVSAQGVYQMPESGFTFSLPSTATDVGDYAIYYTFYQCAGLTSVDLSSLTTVSGDSALAYAFYNCTGLTSADLSSLTTVSGGSALNNAFYGCTGLTSIDLSSLTTVSEGSNVMYDAFYNCTSLTSVDLSSLTTVSGGSALGYAFYGCTGLTSVLFTNLTTIGANSSSSNYGQFGRCFNNCNNLTSITFPKLEKIYCTGSTSTQGTFSYNNKVQKMYFPKLDTITYGSGASSSNQNACKNVFYGCSALTELHFGAANKSAIQATTGYSTAWGRGAGNVTIYFDL